MKNRFFTIGLVALLFAACSVNEMDIATPVAKETEEFFATIEDASTKVFVDDELMVLWHADDRVSIFNKYTYNQQYRFTGNTGANSGSFTKVPNDDFVTGNALNSVYAIYPYKESTEISNQGVLTIDLPAMQSYAENSFGIGANTMVSCSEGNELLFKNLCGYIMLKLYGNDVSVKSISIKGNDDEPLAGKATVNASVDSAPTMAFDASATKEITLTFDTPVTLGSTAETATTFWLVVPPTTFSKGITVTVKDDKNGEFKKSTTASLQISRNTLKRMSALQATPEPSDDAIVFADSKLKDCLVAKFDTNGDGELSHKEAASVTSIDGVITITTISSFNEFQYFTGVKQIPDKCFQDWYKLTSIILPSSLSSIGYQTFFNCENLTSIIIPESVTEVGVEAFWKCTSLTSIAIPKSVTVIRSGAFGYCTSLTSIIIPESVTEIGSFAFEFCTSLTSINIPKSVKTIGEGAFTRCDKLASVFIPSGVTSIGETAFSFCPSIESITVDLENPVYNSMNACNAIIETNTHILINGCMNTIIPESVSSIGRSAFSYCTNLTYIEIPKSVTNIGEGAFSNCTSLSSINVPNGVITIGDSAFYGCDNLSSTIIIPEGVTKIGDYTFSGCSNLSSVVIPESIRSIGRDAFRNCSSLTSITIPESVTSIEKYAFENCSGLIEMYCLRNTPPSGGASMFKNTKDCPIFVPKESVEVYKSTLYWHDYANRILAIGTPIAVDLGLPSGVKWASINLGASKPEEYGDYYAWGETTTKEVYDNSTYKWFDSDGNLTKYNSDPLWGTVDNKTELELEDDAAHVYLGNNWRTPTWKEWRELYSNCDWAWVTINGVNGFRVTSKANENSIFLPAAGWKYVNMAYNGGSSGYYSSSTLVDSNQSMIVVLSFSQRSIDYNSHSFRRNGLSIRAVSD